MCAKFHFSLSGFLIPTLALYKIKHFCYHILQNIESYQFSCHILGL
jgi:hypothetical protein